MNRTTRVFLHVIVKCNRYAEANSEDEKYPEYQDKLIFTENHYFLQYKQR